VGTELECKTVTLNDVDLEVLQGGAGAPLLFLHGANGVAASHPYLQALARERRVIAPSHPGFGRSALPDWLDSVEDVAHLHLALMEHLNVRKVDVVGCSLGGWIAAEIITKSLGLVDKAVLVGPVGVKVGAFDQLDVPDVFALSQDALDKLLFHTPAQSKPDPSKLTDEELAIVYRNRETLALLVWEPYMHNPKLKHRLFSTTSKALFVRGESDGLVSADYLQKYAGLIPGARTTTIPKAGHLPQLEQPDVFVSTVLEFLNA
jgi:pimeloyl-ACP methyl ester carboxylesterase